MTHTFDRRGFLGLAGLAVGTAALSACGGSNSSSTTSSSTSASSSASATASASASASASAAATTPAAVNSKNPARADADLVIWCDNDRYPVIKKYADQFASDNGISAAVQVSTDVRAQFTTAAKVGKGPDVIVGAHDWLGQMVQDGTVQPIQLDPSVASQFAPTAIAATKFNGQTWGVPYAIENLGLVRNTALAPDAPKTVDDLLAAGNKAVKAGKAKQAFVFQVSTVGDAYYMYPWLHAYGGGIFATKSNGDYDPSKVIVNNAGSIKGATEIQKLAQMKLLATSIDYNAANLMFQKGQVPFIITGPWSIAAFKDAGIKYAISNLPTPPGGGTMTPFLGIQMFYIAKNAKNVAFAQEFVTKTMTGKDVQIALYEVGQRPPALTAAYDEVSASNADIKAWYEAGKGALPMPNIPAMNAVWAPLGQAEADIVSGKSQPAARMNAAAAEITKAIKSSS